MPLLKTPAVTLKSRKWGDADRIVVFYTLRFGKLRGVARGARKPKSRFGSALEPFVHSELLVFEKGNDPLCRISQIDIVVPHTRLREDLALIAGAGRLVNLLDAVTAEGDAGPRIFDTLITALRVLETSDDPGLTSLLFQIRLLGHTGFRPLLDHCAGCGAVIREPVGSFSPLAGGFVCRSCAGSRRDRCVPMSPGSCAFLERSLQIGEDLLPRLRATGQVREELERAMDAYVTVVAGRRLPPADFLAAEAIPPTYGPTT